MREHFTRELNKVEEELVHMGRVVVQAIDWSIQALLERDQDLARQVMAGDEEINSLEKNIESHCLNLILRENPVASDLRLLSSVLRMITDLERIGDQAADIAEISLSLEEEDFIVPIVKLPKMAKLAGLMVAQSLQSFASGDLVLADDVILMDDQLDQLFLCLRDQLISLIYEDKTRGRQALDLLMIGKYLERIGDHGENLAEWVIYSVTGKLVHRSS